jgi:hypothetical protein
MYSWRMPEGLDNAPQRVSKSVISICRITITLGAMTYKSVNTR